MKINIELNHLELRSAVKNYLEQRGYPQEVLDEFWRHNFEIKTTWRENEKFRTPTEIKFVIEKKEV
jgi:hypothetical protein